MSWWVYVRPECDCPHPHDPLYERNVTYNNSPIFRKALPTEDGLGSLDDMAGSEALPLLQRAIERLMYWREEFVPLEPANGWGGIDDALDLLQGMSSACAKEPRTRIEVS